MTRVPLVEWGRVAERFGVRAVTWGAVLLALGVALPVVLHPTGTGQVLLPMNFTALLAGLLGGPWVGLAVGALTPLCGALATGMPPLAPYPVAQLMVVELGLYGLIVGLLYGWARVGVIPAVVAANVAGRLAYGLAGFYVLPLFGLPRVPLWFPLTGAVVAGLPGLVAQIVLLPVLVVLIERSLGSGVRSRGARPRLLGGR